MTPTDVDGLRQDERSGATTGLTTTAGMGGPRPPLRIRLVNRTDIGGGAEVVANDQLRSYLARGHDALLLVGRKHGNDPNVLQMGEADKALTPAGRASWERALTDADIVHFHNLHGNYLDHELISGLSWKRVVCATLHDQYSYTGGCIHSRDCPRWQTGCGDCPQRSDPSDGRPDTTADEWTRKRRLWGRSRVHVIAPARWIYKRACSSIWKSAQSRIWHIPNGVDLSTFDAVGRAQPRGDPDHSHQSEIVLLAAAQKLRTNWSKDWALLEATACILGEKIGRPATLIVLGEQAEPARHGDLRVTFAGSIRDRALVAQYYSSADIYLHPSRAETFSLAVLEAMAMGCPIVATDVGGIDEQLGPLPDDPRRCGLITPAGDASAFAAAVMTLVNNAILRASFSVAAIDRVANRWSLDRHIEAHLQLYTEGSVS